MNIGDLDQRLIYIGVDSYVSNGFGEDIPVPGTPVECWCNAVQIGQAETLSYGLDLSEASYQFVVRYEHGQAINTTTDITYKGRTFNPLSPPLNSKEDDGFVVILAAEKRL